MTHRNIIRLSRASSLNLTACILTFLLYERILTRLFTPTVCV